MTILEDIKAGRLVVVPGEVLKRARSTLLNTDDKSSAIAILDRTLRPASPDHTTALLSLVEGMESERDEARGDHEYCKTVADRLRDDLAEARNTETRASVIQTMRLKGLKPSDTVIELCAKYLDVAQSAEARALAAEAERDRLKVERDEARQLAYDLKYAAAGGEDAPGSAHAVTVADIDRWRREQWDVASTECTMRVSAEARALTMEKTDE